MTSDEYIADIEARRDAFQLRLSLIMASDLPPRVKDYRIKLVTREITALRKEVEQAVAVASQKRP